MTLRTSESRKSHNVERREQQAYSEEHGVAVRTDTPYAVVIIYRFTLSD